jgi:hypothetical protein
LAGRLLWTREWAYDPVNGQVTDEYRSPLQREDDEIPYLNPMRKGPELADMVSNAAGARVR